MNYIFNVLSSEGENRLRIMNWEEAVMELKAICDRVCELKLRKYQKIDGTNSHVHKEDNEVLQNVL